MWPTWRSGDVGYCAITEGKGDCAHGTSGSWPLSSLGGKHDLAACVSFCKERCARCNFISFSDAPGHEECSWYAQCGSHLLQAHGGNTYRTRQVRSVASTPPPPPSPPPAQEIPKSASPGYCALMGPDLGSCDWDEQGSWHGVRSAHECVARCAQCSRCRFVSMTLEPVAEEDGPHWRGRRSGDHHAPHWWRCRWYTSCDLTDLRQTPAGAPGYVTVAAAGNASGPVALPMARIGASTLRRGKAALRLAIATIARRSTATLRGGYDVQCAMLQWCQNARRLQASLPPGRWNVTRLLIGTAGQYRWLHGASDCDVEFSPVEEALRHAADSCARTLAGVHTRLLGRGHMADDDSGDGFQHETGYFKKVNLLKWHLVSLEARFDAIIFADADLEIFPLAEHSARAAAMLWHRTLKALVNDPHVRILAEPDYSSPLNGGLTILRPSRALYAEGLAMLRTCAFNRSHGWGLLGRPSSLPPPTVTHASMSAAERFDAHVRLRATRYAKLDNWDFVASDMDQGFYWAIFFLRHRSGTYGRSNRADAPTVRHWWATFKPWVEAPLGNGNKRVRKPVPPSAQAYLDKLHHSLGYVGGNDPMFMARASAGSNTRASLLPDVPCIQRHQPYALSAVWSILVLAGTHVRLHHPRERAGGRHAP